MRICLIKVMSKIGVWFCHQAVLFADFGHIEFEVSIPQKNPILYQIKYPRRKKRSRLWIIYLMAILFGIWSILFVSSTIEKSCKEIKEEIQKTPNKNCFYIERKIL